MSIINVSNAAQLSSALAGAHAGDTIKLAAGDYGDVSIFSKSFSTDVIITSADPLHHAVFDSLSISHSSGIHVDGVDVHFTPDASTMSWTSAVTIDNSSHVTFSHSVMKGGPSVNGVPQTATAGDSTDNVIGLPAGRAITVSNSTSVTVSGNNVSQFDRGVVLTKANGVIVDGNDIHDLRRTAVAGTGSNITIENNHLHDAHPWQWGDASASHDHADFIALFTDATQTAASTNIVIKNNIMAQGAGAPILGMWMQGGTATFTNVTISGNAIETGNSQGIMLSGVNGGSVTHNVLVEPTGGAQAPSILLQGGAQHLDVSGNLTSQVLDYNYGGTGNTLHDNTVVQSTNATATGYYTDALVSKLTGLTADQIYTTVQQGVTVVAAPTGPAVTATSLLSLSGTSGKVLVGGSSSNDNLVGAAGNDTLNGLGGADTLTGGAGNDTYYASSTTKIVEQAGGGIDTVIAKGDYVLGANVENLVISNDAPNNWSGTGNELNNIIIGNAGNNRIDGGLGNDTLDGGLGNDSITGGTGNDVLMGGGGSDSLAGGAGADTFVLAKGYGTDKVFDFNQADGDHITVVGDTYTVAQVGADTVVKLASGDTMTLAGVSLNSLHAGWISQSATLPGASTVTSTTTSVTSSATTSSSTTTTQSSTTSTAPSSPAVAPSALTTTHGVSLVGGGGTNDNLVGTSGDDTLNGAGGYDTLTGGAGNDTYYANSMTKIVELAGGGTDTVIAKGDYVLGANLENLTISSDATNSWAGTGNELNNVIIGNAGNNKLDGQAGNDTISGGGGNDAILGGLGNDSLSGDAGNDTLTGGAGADAFYFGHGGGADRVTDFNYVDGDRVHVADTHYTVSQVGADTVVDLGNGDTLTLAGVNYASLSTHHDWIVVG